MARRPASPFPAPPAGAADRQADGRDPAWWPLYVTGGDATAGYAGYEVWRITDTVEKQGGRTLAAANPGFPLVPGATFAAGDYALVRSGPGTGGLEFEMVPVGITGAAVAAALAATDCRASAGWDEDTCLTWAVPAAGRGRCASVPAQTGGRMAWDADAGGTGVGGWVSQITPLITDAGAGILHAWRERGAWVGKVVVGEDEHWLTFLGCRDNKPRFAGGSGLCVAGEGEIDVTCGDNTFEIELGCTPCDEDDDGAADLRVACCPGTLFPTELCVTLSGFPEDQIAADQIYINPVGGDTRTLNQTFVLRYNPYRSDPITGSTWWDGGYEHDPIAGGGVYVALGCQSTGFDDGFAWVLNGGRVTGYRDGDGYHAYGVYADFAGTASTADCGPPLSLVFDVESASVAVPYTGTATIGPVPAEGCGTAGGTDPEGDAGGCCDAILGVGGPADGQDIQAVAELAGVGYATHWWWGRWTAATASANGFFVADTGGPNYYWVLVQCLGGTPEISLYYNRFPAAPGQEYIDALGSPDVSASGATANCGDGCATLEFTDAAVLAALNVVGTTLGFTSSETGVCTGDPPSPAPCVGCGGAALAVGDTVTGSVTDVGEPARYCFTYPTTGNRTFTLTNTGSDGSVAAAFSFACDGASDFDAILGAGGGPTGYTHSQTAGTVYYVKITSSFGTNGYTLSVS